MTVEYLRISITDRCNLRCIYCNPLGVKGLLDPHEVLSYEEICRLAGLFADRGIRKIRLTGGEPLVRKDVTTLVGRVSRLSGIDDLALTTNGVLLGEMAGDLKEAGLGRINVSIDSLDRSSYKSITGVDCVERVLKGVDKAVEVGFSPVKINAVIIKDVNQGDVVRLVAMAAELPVIVRFIEYFPTARNTAPPDRYVPNSIIRREIENHFGLLASLAADKSSEPAHYFKLAHSEGIVGFISGRSSIFCDRCNRLRLTSDGHVKPCLYSGHTYDMKKLLRNGATDLQILAEIDRIMSEKHNYTKLNSFTEEFSMQNVGG